MPFSVTLGSLLLAVTAPMAGAVAAPGERGSLAGVGSWSKLLRREVDEPSSSPTADEEEDVGGKDLFKQADTDNSGYMEEKEVEGFMKKIGAQAKWSAFDKDKDGRLSFTEFMAAGRIMSAMRRRQEKGRENYSDEDGDADEKSNDQLQDESQDKQVFTDADADQSGFLENEECEALSKMTGIQDFHWKEFDENQDNRLSFDEFLEAGRQTASQVEAEHVAAVKAAVAAGAVPDPDAAPESASLLEEPAEEASPEHPAMSMIEQMAGLAALNKGDLLQKIQKAREEVAAEAKQKEEEAKQKEIADQAAEKKHQLLGLVIDMYSEKEKKLQQERETLAKMAHQVDHDQSILARAASKEQ